MTHHDNSQINDIDDRLNNVGQQTVKNLVQGLPADTVSLAWRSSLNEQLLAVSAQKQRKRRLQWILRPAAGLSLATLCAIVFIVQPYYRHASVKPDFRVENAILNDHHNSALLNEVSSAGLNSNEVISDANSQDLDDDLWSDSDAQSL